MSCTQQQNKKMCDENKNNVDTINMIGQVLRGEISEMDILPCRLTDILGMALLSYNGSVSEAAESELRSALTHEAPCVKAKAICFLLVFRADGRAKQETIEAIEEFQNNPKNKALSPNDEQLSRWVTTSWLNGNPVSTAPFPQ